MASSSTLGRAIPPPVLTGAVSSAAGCAAGHISITTSEQIAARQPIPIRIAALFPSDRA
jgi:hypothetical protein